jgi:cell division protein FtsW (lipid II flippase)
MALQYGAYIAMAGIGLYAIFVGEMISIFNYMQEPAQQVLDDDFIKPPVEPHAKILQFISIGVAPGLVMSATSYMIARKFGSKQIGWLIIAGGLVLLIGMFYANTMIDGIEKDLRVFTVTITPPLFMAVSIPMMVVGALLFRIKKRPKKYF